MIIDKAVYDAITLHCPHVPPETGGILGGHGEHITDVIFDVNHQYTNQAVYRPNVDFLNHHIALWIRQGIEFRGIFHSHLANQLELSKDDQEYIIKIMSAMPTSINELFFPIIIPTRNILVYRAKRNTYGIVIQPDCLQQL